MEEMGRPTRDDHPQRGTETRHPGEVYPTSRADSHGSGQTDWERMTRLSRNPSRPAKASNNIDECGVCLRSHDGLLRAATLVALRGERRSADEGARPLRPYGPAEERAAALAVAAPGLDHGEAPAE